LITGASSGIGLELARVAAADGHDLILVARRIDKLEQLGAELHDRHGVDSVALSIDLSRPDAVPKLTQTLAERGLAVDVLVNNAGFGDRGTVVALAESRQLDMIQVNVVALTALTRSLLPQMIARKRGAILNVASTAAFQAGPEMSVYYASKAYVLHFTEGLHEELLGSGVRVTCLCPGPTETGFSAQAHMEDALLFRLGSADAHAVAQAGWTALKDNRTVVIPGIKNWLLAFSTRLAPRAALRKIARRLQTKNA
jgi:short-subunit dehydrogenase